MDQKFTSSGFFWKRTWYFLTSIRAHEGTVLGMSFTKDIHTDIRISQIFDPVENPENWLSHSILIEPFPYDIPSQIKRQFLIAILNKKVPD
jgi:hypothetical protein